MYKLLVVEDEEIIRNGIINSIKWNELGYEIIGQVANGKEGLDFVRNLKPDVILTDVRMPVMDGLKMSEHILKIHPEIKIVILSGFADFAYAQQAIRFKAFDYLLKPTDKNKFLQCFLRLKVVLDKEREEYLARLKIQEKLYENLIKAREDFLLKMIQGDMPVGSMLADSLQNLEIDFSGQDYAAGIITLDMVDTCMKESRENDEALIKSTISNILAEFLENGNFGIAVVKNILEIVILFNFKSQPYTPEKAACILKKAMNSLEKMLHDMNTKAYAALGLAYPQIYKIAKSYEQAKTCLDKKFYSDKTNFYFFSETDKEASRHEQKWIDGYPKEANAIIEAVLNGKPESAAEMLSGMYERFESLHIPPDIVKDYSCFLCLMLHSGSLELQLKDDLPIVHTGYNMQIQEAKSIQSLIEFVTRIFYETGTVIKSGKNLSGGKDIVENVRRYIHAHYSSDISLEKLSHELFISPSYLSYLFKFISGESYSDYLKNTRLNKAKELLEDKPELKVYEVCYLVGYKEYKYFSLQFKNAFGFSPTELRKYSKEVIRNV